MKKHWLGYIGLNLLLGALAILTRGSSVIQSIVIFTIIVLNILLITVLDKSSKSLHATLSDIVSGPMC